MRVQQQVCALRGVGEVEDIQAAKQVLKEARNSRAVRAPETRFVLFFLVPGSDPSPLSSSLQLYPSLCELAHVLSVDGPVRQRLDSLAGELAKAADKELQVGSEPALRVLWRPPSLLTSRPLAGVRPQVIVDSMVSLCRELCPLSSSAAERLSPPLSSIAERVSVPRSSIRTALMERAAQDVHRALE